MTKEEQEFEDLLDRMIPKEDPEVNLRLKAPVYPAPKPRLKEDSYSYTEKGHTLEGKIVACQGCGRKLFVTSITFQARCGNSLGGTCLECLVLNESFREAHPDVAAHIDGWQKES